MWYVSDMVLGLGQKLVLGGLAIVAVVSYGFTLLQLTLTRTARAVFFAHEVAASIGDRTELQSGARLERQNRQIKDVRRRLSAVTPARLLRCRQFRWRDTRP